jgi:hypothetical protein
MVKHQHRDGETAADKHNSATDPAGEIEVKNCQHETERDAETQKNDEHPAKQSAEEILLRIKTENIGGTAEDGGAENDPGGIPDKGFPPSIGQAEIGAENESQDEERSVNPKVDGGPYQMALKNAVKIHENLKFASPDRLKAPGGIEMCGVKAARMSEYGILSCSSHAEHSQAYFRCASITRR